MVPACMVNEETLNQVPEDVRRYMRDLRRRIIELERTPSQQQIADLELEIRKLRVENDDLRSTIGEQQEQIKHLKQDLVAARSKVPLNSTNSSLPPSSNRFHAKRSPPRDPKAPRKKSGGQRGHKRHQRLLVPSAQVRETIACKPKVCRRCRKPLSGSDPAPLRHQVAELPVVRPDVVEYQLHRLVCPCCNLSTCGTLPAEVYGHFGPRLEATFALLAGRARLSLRSVMDLARDLWGLSICAGMVSKLRRRSGEALLKPWDEVAGHVQTENVNIDETTWRENKKRVHLWIVVTAKATLYRIAKGRTAQVAKELLGEKYAKVATCDRLKSYWWIKQLQWCWSHLRRDFQAMIDRGNAGKAIGEALLAQSNRLFHLWHQVKAEKLSRVAFQAAMKPVQEAVRQALQRGVACGCSKTAGTCKELLGNSKWLWTFVTVEGVEPTNNAGEQKARQPVLLRKTSGGTASATGSRFVERVLTVVHTCQQQGKSVMDYLYDCIQAWRQKRAPPPLLAGVS